MTLGVTEDSNYTNIANAIRSMSASGTSQTMTPAEMASAIQALKATWGHIDGTLTDQIDLKNALSDLDSENLIWNTLNPTLTDFPSINGMSTIYAPSNVTLSVAEHGMRGTANVNKSHFTIYFGSAVFDNGGLYGLEKGKYYTLSWDLTCKISGAANINSYFFHATENDAAYVRDSAVKIYEIQNSGTYNEHVKYTFYLDESYEKFYFSIHTNEDGALNVQNGDYIEYRNLMLQKGIVDSSWKPNLRDYIISFIDDTAGSGDTKKVWSADKSTSMSYCKNDDLTSYNALTECQKSGWYTGTSSDMNKLSDKPTDFPTTGGCHLNVRNNSFGHSNFIMQLLYATTGECWYRLINTSSVVVDWTKIANPFLIDDTAGSGDIKKVWSADKSTSISFCKNDDLTSYNLLTECQKSGWYTGTVTDLNNLSDKPTDFPTTGGCHLEVRNNSFGHSNYIMQLLYATTGECWYRLINTGSVVVDWTKIIKFDQYEEFKYVDRISTGSNTLLSECRNSGWYTDSSDKMKLMVDKPSDFTNTGAQLEVRTHSYGTYSSNYMTQKLFDTKGNSWFRLLNSNGSVNVDWIKNQSQIKTYSKLYVSMLGDSISSYKGYVPTGNPIYYTGSNYGVTSVNKMWWKIAIDEIGATPLIMDGWSGSCVASGVREPISTNSYLAQSDVSRCQRLHAYIEGTPEEGGYDLIVTSENIDTIRTSPFLDSYTPAVGDYVKRINPDIIFLTGGGNDYSYGCALGTWDGHSKLNTETTTTFREAYANMINRIQNEYPYALIVCCIPPFLVRPSFDDDTHSKDQVNINDSTHNTYHDYHKAIREIAELMACPVVDMFACGFNRKNYYDTFCQDSETKPTHPNAVGHQVIGKNVASQLLNVCSGYIDWLKSKK